MNNSFSVYVPLPKGIWTLIGPKVRKSRQIFSSFGRHTQEVPCVHDSSQPFMIANTASKALSLTPRCLACALSINLNSRKCFVYFLPICFWRYTKRCRKGIGQSRLFSNHMHYPFRRSIYTNPGIKKVIMTSIM